MSIDSEEVQEATQRIAAPIEVARARSESAFIFRVDTEWYALPTSACDRVIDACAIHSVPHRAGGILLGVGNVAGDIVLVISLPALLSAAHSDAEKCSRMLLFSWRHSHFALPVSEVSGVQRFHPDERLPAPATLATASAYTSSILSWNGSVVGFLDPDRLYAGIVKGVA